jgi:hypothetical protein
MRRSYISAIDNSGIGSHLPGFRDDVGVKKITRGHAQSSTLQPVSRSRSMAKSSNFGPPSNPAMVSIRDLAAILTGEFG